MVSLQACAFGTSLANETLEILILLQKSKFLHAWVFYLYNFISKAPRAIERILFPAPNVFENHAIIFYRLYRTGANT